MHIAAAVTTPVIEISSFPKNGDNSHANAPLRFGAWTKEKLSYSLNKHYILV